jgi:hypothetical protein
MDCYSLSPAELRRRSTLLRQHHHAHTGIWLPRRTAEALVRILDGSRLADAVRPSGPLDWKPRLLERFRDLATAEVPMSGVSQPMAHQLTRWIQEDRMTDFTLALATYQEDLDEVSRMLAARPGGWPAQREWEAQTWRRREWDPALTQWLTAALQEPTGQVMATLRPHIPDDDLSRWVREAVVQGEAAPLRVLLPWVPAAHWNRDNLHEAIRYDHQDVLQALLEHAPMLDEEAWVDLAAHAFLEVSPDCARELMNHTEEAPVADRLRTHAGPHAKEAWFLWEHLAEVRAECPEE